MASKKGTIGFIVPISSVSTPRMQKLHELIMVKTNAVHVSNYAVRPGKLFDGVDMNLTIFIIYKNDNTPEKKSTNYIRWYDEERACIFSNIYYQNYESFDFGSIVPKIKSDLETKIIKKISIFPQLNSYANRSETVYYHSGGRYFRKCLLAKLSNEYKELAVPKGGSDQIVALLSSSLYYWYWLVVSDTYHVTKRNIEQFNIATSIFYDSILGGLGQAFIKEIMLNSNKRNRTRKDGSTQVEVNFSIGKSKPLIDEIDTLIATHYDFTEEELDFIINYDIKYRMGRGSGEETE